MNTKKFLWASLSALLLVGLFAVIAVGVNKTLAIGESGPVPDETILPPPPSGPSFPIGSQVRVTSSVRVREFRSTSAPRACPGSQQPGVIGTVLEGPFSNEGYTWYRINYASSACIGWSVSDGTLELVSGGSSVPPPPPSGPASGPFAGFPPPPPPPPPPFTPSSAGERIVLVNFSDNPSDRPFSPSAIQSAFFSDSPDSLKGYFRRASYGRVILDGSVSDWVTLSRPRPTGCSRADLVSIVSEASSLAGGGTIFLVNGCGISGEPDNGVIISMGTADRMVKTAVHEIGHRFGFGHAGSAPGAAAGDFDDPMGNAFNSDAPLRPFNMVHKSKAGWLTEQNIQRVTQNTTVNLQCGDTSTGQQPTGVVDIQIPVGAKTYHVERRCDPQKDMTIRVEQSGAVDSAVVDAVTVQTQDGVTIQSLSSGQVRVTFSGSSSTPPPPPPPGSPTSGGSPHCPGRNCSAPVNTEFGSYALTCPIAPVHVQQGTTVRVPMMAVGTYAAGRASVTVPVRPVGTPLTPHLGIRQDPPEGWYGLEPGGILDFPVSVNSEVPVGSYSVPMRATLTDYDYSTPPEPRLREKYSYCNLNLIVGPYTGPNPSGPMANIYTTVGAGIPVKEIRVQPGQTVPVQWSSRGASACFLKVNGQDRALPRDLSGSTIGGNMTSDPVRAEGADIYELKCQILGTLGFTDTDTLVVGPPASDPYAHGPGGLTVTLEAQGSSRTFYGTVPKDPVGRVIDFVHVESGGTVNFLWASQGASSCTVTPAGLSGPSGVGSVSNIQAPFDLSVTCTSASGGSATKSVRVVLNPGEPVTGVTHTGSISCSPLVQSVVGGQQFTEFVQTPGITGPLTVALTTLDGYQGHLSLPSTSLAGGSTSRVVRVNTIPVRPPYGAHPPTAGIAYRLDFTDQSGSNVGSCQQRVLIELTGAQGTEPTIQTFTLTSGGRTYTPADSPVTLPHGAQVTIAWSSGDAMSCRAGRDLMPHASFAGVQIGGTGATGSGSDTVPGSTKYTVFCYKEPPGQGTGAAQKSIDVIATGSAAPGASMTTHSITVGGSTYVVGAGGEVVGGTGVRLRSGPSTREPVRDVLKPGEDVTILGDRVQAGGYTWLRVLTSDGQTGFVAANTTLKPSQATPPTVKLPPTTGGNTTDNRKPAPPPLPPQPLPVVAPPAVQPAPPPPPATSVPVPPPPPPASTVTPPPPPSSSSSGNYSVALFSPGGGEQFEKGSTMIVVWSTQGLPTGSTLLVKLVSESSSVAPIIINTQASPSANYLYWSIPTSLQDGRYKVMVVCQIPGGGSCSAQSADYFRVGGTSGSSGSTNFLAQMVGILDAMKKLLEANAR